MKRFSFIFLKLLFIPLIIRSNTPSLEKSNYFETENFRIHYTVSFPKNQKISGKVFLVHGFCGSIYSWRNNIDDLTKNGNMVIAVDLPSFGQSEKNSKNNLAFELIAENLWDLLSEIDLKINNHDSWNLTGHSLGAEIVARMVLQNQNRVATLTIVDGLAGHRLSAVNKFLLQQTITRSLIGISVKNFFLKEKNIAKVLAKAYGRKPTNEEIENYFAPMKDKNFVGSVLNFTKNYTNAIDLTQITIPVLLIWGENDKWVIPQQALELKNILPNATLITLKNTSHCPMETAPEQFNYSLISFLQINEKKIENLVRK